MMCEYTIEGDYKCPMPRNNSWHPLYKASFKYPINPSDNHKIEFIKFFNKYISTLPSTWQPNINKLPKLRLEDLQSRETLSYYIYILHGMITNMLGKQHTLKYEDIKQKYDN